MVKECAAFADRHERRRGDPSQSISLALVARRSKVTRAHLPISQGRGDFSAVSGSGGRARVAAKGLRNGDAHHVGRIMLG